MTNSIDSPTAFTRRTIRRRWTAALTVAAVTATGFVVVAPTASAAPAPLTNLAHLDFLLDEVSPTESSTHTTYGIAEDPSLVVPWTYADARDGGTFERVGGGPFDPATGDYEQGAYNADDITRTAVVYIRHWKQTGSETSRDKAYELLRSVAFFQTTSGPYAGNVVLWMQTDGEFNPSPIPVELPDPSDSEDSYWLARTLWALGEGYAAFADEDPEFAAFLQDRVQLGVQALDREVLGDYGQYDIADGVKVPSWLIVDGADATAEAVLGLAAYSAAAPDDAATKSALAKLSEGIAALGSGDIRTWPYGAILPWAKSRSLWHAYASQQPAALAAASAVLGDAKLLEPALADSAVFTPTLLTGGGPDNGWQPSPSDRVQIAYGVDSRLQSLLTVAEVADRPGLRELAGIVGAWYFGANRSGEPVYNPETGVTFDGVQPDGTINRNSGAESAIHGLLSMLALDANPDVAQRAQATGAISAIDGLMVVEAEASASTSGTVVTPESSWTGESAWSGGSYLELDRGESAVIAVGGGSGARRIEPVVNQQSSGSPYSVWRTGYLPLGALKHTVGAQGVTEAPGAILPQPLVLPLSTPKNQVTVTAARGPVQLDSVIVRPVVSRLVLTGDSASTELVNSASVLSVKATVGAAGQSATVRSYDKRGVLVEERAITGRTTISLSPGGFAIVTR